jgi:hypothetical protein
MIFVFSVRKKVFRKCRIFLFKGLGFKVRNFVLVLGFLNLESVG